VNNVPLVDLSVQHAEIEDDVRQGFERVLASGGFIGGQEVTAFEEEYAAFVGVEHCIGVANGTDALELALRAVGVSRDDEVILPANTFIATAEAVLRAGGRPVLVDVDSESLLVDPDKVASALTPRTRAVIPVHLYGQAAPVEALPDSIGERGIAIVEDAAQAQGARRGHLAAGGLGTVAATSFYPGKNLGAYGDAGAVLTHDSDVARRVRLMGSHGSSEKYIHSVLGFNSRLDSLQAVVLRAKLRRLADWNEQRATAAQFYDQELTGRGGVRLPVCLAGNKHVWHLYVVRVAHRDAVLGRLRSEGIEAGIHYPVPVHLQPAMAGLGYSVGDFPVAESSAEECLSLPLFPGITRGQQERVVETLVKAIASEA
jgi:dTDP-4-amino-4,6-dideoxygalactose transaminase